MARLGTVSKDESREEPNLMDRTRHDRRLNLEFATLESRRLLSSTSTLHVGGGAAYSIVLTGPGSATPSPLPNGAWALDLVGTSSRSQLTIRETASHRGLNSQPLRLGRVSVETGTLGAFQAAESADLTGPMSPLRGPVGVLAFHGVSGAATIQSRGALGALAVTRDLRLRRGAIKTPRLGGPITVGGNVVLKRGLVDAGNGLTANESVTIGAGGQLRLSGPLVAGRDLVDSGSIAAASVSIARNAVISVGAQLLIGGGGSASVGGALAVNGGRVELGRGSAGVSIGGATSLTPGGVIRAEGDVFGPMDFGGDLVIAGGSFVLDRDLNGGFRVAGDLRIQDGGALNVGRDLNAVMSVDGDVHAATGGQLLIGRNLSSLSIQGNLDTSRGGRLATGGNLGTLAIVGYFVGSGSGDLRVGLDLGRIEVRGGVESLGGVNSADIDVAKSITNVDIAHGVFFSFITAGVAIVGGPAAGGSNIGPDGPIAVFDSQIRAGVQIRDFVFGGDVMSDLPGNPSGRPTRIVAGMNRQGTLMQAGNLSNVTLTGILIDAVLAASVAPGPNGVYDAPGGTYTIGQVGAPQTVFVFTAPPYDPADPTVDDIVLPGAINLGFAPVPLPAIPPPTPEMSFPVPSQSTIPAGVITTVAAADDRYDHAGLFAAGASGVFVGTLPR